MMMTTMVMVMMVMMMTIDDDGDDGDDGDEAHNCGQVIWETADLPVNLCLPPQNLLRLTWTEYKEKQATYISFYIIYFISYK